MGRRSSNVSSPSLCLSAFSLSTGPPVAGAGVSRATRITCASVSVGSPSGGFSVRGAKRCSRFSPTSSCVIVRCVRRWPVTRCWRRRVAQFGTLRGHRAYLAELALYRLICALGQHSLVAVLTRCGLPLPLYFLVDEKHSRCRTTKCTCRPLSVVAWSGIWGTPRTPAQRPLPTRIRSSNARRSTRSQPIRCRI